MRRSKLWQRLFDHLVGEREQLRSSSNNQIQNQTAGYYNQY